MKNSLDEVIESLKQSYKYSLLNDCADIQENLFNCILKLTNLSQNISLENSKIPMENKENIVKFDLLHLDGQNNEYYIYPVGEAEFKKLAYEEGKIFVRVFHENGKIENTIRKVNRIWTSSVLWNINSMYSEFIVDKNGNQCHYSKGKNLKVYACPFSYKNHIPKNI